MTAYYNENDPYAAAWLRNLIAAGHIPAGEVDDRSILDVEPGDLDGYDECHFFAGIGGWPYALALAGWTGPVWTGSCPCQPLSSAGQRRGHADERHLWPAFHALIAECKPPTVFGEQVASKDGREWLSGVRADLEHLGYAVGAADIPAAGVGAPHIRQRLFWVAESDSATNQREWRELPAPQGAAAGWCDNRHRCSGATGGLADSDTGRRQSISQPHIGAATGQQTPRWMDANGSGATGGLADAEHDDGRPDLARRGPQGRDVDFWSDAVWLGCLDGKARRVEPSIQPLVDARGCICGLRLGEVCACAEKPSRVGMLRGAGNAISPPVAAAFVSAFLATR